MLNRLPPNATKGIPEDVIREHGNLLWIHRALADLEKFPRSERCNTHYDRVIRLLDSSAASPHDQPDLTLCQEVFGRLGDTGLDSIDAGPWYHRFLMPGSVVNWFSNLTIGDGVLFATGATIMVVILILAQGYIHPN